ncbi:hypothetical protein EJ03DRAFT_333338 [Teratosphaeria nubilosa]|uniref:Zn(2)-C6 fungal-type domain-containing protein n=1 Tax=Teratosphaeria nubilosa TaxID=161662 RepID=A0A6G1LLE1_9PEZI|nr:hypothetical protein EJ03DRAFT_333338 [Teratosphaeria nubilosa]
MGAIDPALTSDGADEDLTQQIPPISQALPQGPTMQTLQPQHPDQYRALPAPPQMYAPPYQQQMPYPPNQPAPRQRTAIACRYCRRRKIRCSGFDQSEDGRCTNCQRFSQECVFTPVSAQTHAFVPAHTVWRGQNPPPNTQLYGAYGQPLPQGGQRDPYQQQQQPGQPGQYPPPPQGYQQQGMYPPQPNMQQMPGQQAGSKRANDEPHTPTMPPPNPAEQGQRGSFSYDPSGLTGGASPASSNASFHSSQPQPYFAGQPPASRSSSQSVYSHDPSRASSSPHAMGQFATPSTSPMYGPVPPHGIVPANAGRPSAKVNNVVDRAGPQQQQQQQSAAQAAIKQEENRTSHDANMLQALNRGPI